MMGMGLGKTRQKQPQDLWHCNENISLLRKTEPALKNETVYRTLSTNKSCLVSHSQLQTNLN